MCTIRSIFGYDFDVEIIYSVVTLFLSNSRL